MSDVLMLALVAAAFAAAVAYARLCHQLGRRPATPHEDHG
jgi:alkylation response protein AidB-like acyl-CoA dehydrogenase